MGFKGKRGKIVRLERRKYASKASKGRSGRTFQVNAQHDHSYSMRLETDTCTLLPQPTDITSNAETSAFSELGCLDPGFSEKTVHSLNSADTLEATLASLEVQYKGESEDRSVASFSYRKSSGNHDGNETNSSTDISPQSSTGNSVISPSWKATVATGHPSVSTSSEDLSNVVATNRFLLSENQSEKDHELIATSSPCSSTTHITDIIARIGPRLPKSWCAVSSAGFLQIVKRSPTRNISVHQSLSIDLKGKVIIFINKKPLPADHELWSDNLIQSGVGPVCSSNAASAVRNISEVTRLVDSYVMCCGEPGYNHLWAKFWDCKVDENFSQEESCMKTLRSVTCSQLIKHSFGDAACQSCTKLSARLRKIHSNSDNLSEKGILLYGSKKYCRFARKNKSIQQCKTLLLQQSQIIDRLISKIIILSK